MNMDIILLIEYSHRRKHSEMDLCIIKFYVLCHLGLERSKVNVAALEKPFIFEQSFAKGIFIPRQSLLT